MHLLSNSLVFLKARPNLSVIPLYLVMMLKEAVAKLHEEAEPASTPAGHSTSPTLNSSSSSNNTGNNNGSSGNSNSSSGRRVSTSGSSAKPQKSQLSLIAGSIKTKRRSVTLVGNWQFHFSLI